jgi:hypothetical protein
MIGDSVIRNPDGSGDIVGVVDLIICATCLHQAGRLVHMASPAEVDDLVHQVVERDEQIEKLKDGIQAWQERFLGMANLDIGDFAKLAALEEQSKVVTPEP